MPESGDRFTGRERMQHEMRGWIFTEFTFLSDSEPHYVVTGYEELSPIEERSAMSQDFITDEWR